LLQQRQIRVVAVGLQQQQQQYYSVEE